jgi:GT2 family glycosyltransferase
VSEIRMGYAAQVADDRQARTALRPRAGGRPRIQGKFVFFGEQKLFVCGVTYGTFRPGEDGSLFPRWETVENDFAQMAANGVNAIRTYSLPPRWLLDLAEQAGLWVMVGLWGEQYVLHEKKLARSTEEGVRAGVRSCAGHPAVLCYALANEIPASVVRWYGVRRVERFLKRLYEAAKVEDPSGLVTYVNYPTTEYLDLPFLDLVCFNVYLETQESWEAYLARLHTVAGERPLLMAEMGLDSRRNGELTQAGVLDWQIRTTFAAGCAGAFVYAWTDEWHCGGFEIENWDFGLTRRDRQPKPALAAVRHAYSEVPFALGKEWPRVSVVVCTYNGKRTLQDCLRGLLKLEYPNYEVIVVSDGSNDGTVALASGYGFQVITGQNQGLSAARNRGLQAASGDIVAYIDDDAYPDPHWLTYLAQAFMTTKHAGVGGPNVVPPQDGAIAQCVANAPGNPTHVLLSDLEAEHIPGCNMAFRKSCLQELGGFDARFRFAGDDVDVCWKLQERGETLGFAPSAFVWHHRRSSVESYLKQQWNYGVAEAMLEERWPEKYSVAGHPTWRGRIYSQGLTQGLNSLRSRIYHGVWGSAPFQRLYEPPPSFLESLLLMPEWYLAVAGLAALVTLGILWPPLLFVVPLLALAMGLPVFQAVRSAARAKFTGQPKSRLGRLKLHMLVTVLHVLQPVARLGGRLHRGLGPFQLRGLSTWTFPWNRTAAIWSEEWKPALAWNGLVQSALTTERARWVCGGAYDDWDFAVRNGPFASARVGMAVEEHGGGRQFVRFRIEPRCLGGLLATFIPALAAALAIIDGAWIVGVMLGTSALVLAGLVIGQCGVAVGKIVRALNSMNVFTVANGG